MSIFYDRTPFDVCCVDKKKYKNRYMMEYRPYSGDCVGLDILIYFANKHTLKLMYLQEEDFHFIQKLQNVFFFSFVSCQMAEIYTLARRQIIHHFRFIHIWWLIGQSFRIVCLYEEKYIFFSACGWTKTYYSIFFFFFPMFRAVCVILRSLVYMCI